ncbi:PRC-barrel domain-containing protein [Halanaerobium sp. Z-7514]|uniref:PRC-barrel domain-containing protein n=1 Tax=Halanaerobium polyolivorans TaxID=2886943 RepID=A0AAW4X050_9FIRM|nr:PRC-barrel domain-containing protein [Halanaerobium polyolivorans]MCC3144961.1 PRC-barrel domain-containing protein [Halanaerobium polyolivorans]
MLRKLNELKAFKVQGKEEELGEVSDFYFDQDHFILRYLVLDTDCWLKKEQTLISTDEIEAIDHNKKEIKTTMRAEALENGPSLEKNQPISKIMEENVVDYYDWPLYWASTSSGGVPTIPAGTKMREKLFDFETLTDEEKQAKEEELDSNLRSLNEISGYEIQAVDKSFGKVKDLFVDEEDWLIRYLLIDTRKILPSKKVIIAPEWVRHISWDKKQIFVDKSKKEIKNAPKYEEDEAKELVDRDYEEDLYDHYDEPKYWP